MKRSGLAFCVLAVLAAFPAGYGRAQYRDITADTSCVISGPGSVRAWSTNVYSVSTNLPSPAYLWTTSGNATITGAANQSAASVIAGPPDQGPFIVQVLVTSAAGADSCALPVTVTYAPSPPGANEIAKLMIHLTAPQPYPCVVRPPCDGASLVTSGTLHPDTWFAHVLVGDVYTDGQFLSGLMGTRFGIEYDNAPGQGVDILTWTSCPQFSFGSDGWPASGTGNRVSWVFETCQRIEPGGPGTGVVAQAGYFYLAAYSPDRLSLRPHPVYGDAAIWDCEDNTLTVIEGNGIHRTPSQLGEAGFGGLPGYNPCDQVIPVERTTWGKIKTLFGH